MGSSSLTTNLVGRSSELVRCPLKSREHQRLAAQWSVHDSKEKVRVTVLMTKVADVRETALKRGPGHEPREHNSDEAISTASVLSSPKSDITATQLKRFAPVNPKAGETLTVPH